MLFFLSYSLLPSSSGVKREKGEECRVPSGGGLTLSQRLGDKGLIFTSTRTHCEVQISVPLLWNEDLKKGAILQPLLRTSYKIHVQSSLDLSSVISFMHEIHHSVSIWKWHQPLGWQSLQKTFKCSRFPSAVMLHRVKALLAGAAFLGHLIMLSQVLHSCS